MKEGKESNPKFRPVPQDFDLTGDFTPSISIVWFTPREPIIVFSNQNSNLKYVSLPFLPPYCFLILFYSILFIGTSSLAYLKRRNKRVHFFYIKYPA